MPSFKRPGSYAEEIVLTPQALSGGGTAGFAAAFIGTNGRGPTTPTFISTWSEYLTYFGAFSGSYLLPFALFQFFANGGSAAYVTRVAGVGAVTATRQLQDTLGAGTIQISAYSPGAWGNSVFIDVTSAGASGAGRFTLNVHYGNSSAASIVETWSDLSMDPTDSRYVINVINAANRAGSSYITVTNLNSTNPLVQAIPATQSGTVLATGADGTAAGSTEYIAAVNTLELVAGPLVINLPGVNDTTTLTATINYAAGRSGGGFVVADTAQGLTSSSAVSAAATLPLSSYAAVYWPWVLVSDPASQTNGASRYVPPGGAVVGQYLKNDAARGIHKAPAGMANKIAGAVGLEVKLTNADLDALNTAVPPVNAIRLFQQQGPTVFGTRTLDPTPAGRYIPVRRTLIYIEHNVKNILLNYVFENNGPLVWSLVKDDVTNFLMEIWQNAGLSGGTPGDAFYVKCDATVNTPAVVQAGQLIVEVGVATQTPAEFAVLRIGQTNGGASIAATTN